MSTKKLISPFLSRTLSSNGDSASEEDDVFVNSRLDVMSRNCDLDQHSDFDPSNSGCFLNFKMEEGSIPSIFTPSPKAMENAVIFSVHFCGKYFGEVGLFEPDISVLDWVGFKSYIFSSLNLESFDNYMISYCDEDGDKISIESEDDYLEALKIAKIKACDEEKLSLHISRIGGGFPSSLRSLVSSSLRRVNSVGTSRTSTSQPPQKKDVTTSTSFHSLDKANSNNSTEFNRDDISSSYIPIDRYSKGLNSPQENYFSPSNRPSEFVFKAPSLDSIPRTYSAYAPANGNWDSIMVSSQEERESSPQVPSWFSTYMKQFKEDLSLEVSSKIDERFDEAVGNISATDVEAKLKGLLTGYSSELQNKVLCCCKPQSGHCLKSFQTQNSLGPEKAPRGGTETPVKSERDHLSTPLSDLGLERRDDSIDGEASNNQDYFLQKLLKREQEILDFLDCTNEKIKQKIKVNSDYTNSLRSCLTKELAIEERERVLARIEDFRQRQSRTTNDIKMLQQSMEVNNESILRLNLQEATPPKDYDAKFIKDESFVDGSKVLPDQCFRKHWAVQNIGLKPWDNETFLVCQSYHQIKPFNEKILCPPLQPGEIGRISSEFRAPIAPGIYSTEWRFSHGNKLFGNHLWCTVIVPPETSFTTGDKSSIQVSEDLEFEGSGLGDFSKYIDYSGNDNELFENHLINGNEISSKYEPESEEYFALKTKDTLCKMTSEQLLRYFLYIMRIAQPDFGPLRGSRSFKAFYNCLTRGDNRDYFNLRLLMDATFLKNCSRNNFTLDEMIRSYEDIFLTDRESENDELYVKDLSFRYLHKTFDSPEINLGFDPGSESLDNDDTEKNSPVVDSNRKESVEEYEHFEKVASPYSDAAAVEALQALIEATNLTTEEEGDLSSEDENEENFDRASQRSECSDQEVDHLEDGYEAENDLHDEDDDEREDEEEVDEEKVGKRPKEGARLGKPNLHDFILENLYDSANDGGALSGDDDADDEEEEEEEDGEEEGEGDQDENEEHEDDKSQNACLTESNLETEDEVVDGKEEEILEDLEDEPDNDTDFCRLNGDDRASSGYSEYTDSESSHESDVDEKQLSNESDVDKASKNYENDVGKEEEESEEEEEEVVLSTAETPDSRMYEEESLPSCSNREPEHIEPSKPSTTDLKKDINSLHENFNQNVQVHLDFEVISRRPPLEERVRERSPPRSSDPLTFQERHFTISSRPPPTPVQVPESDDESFDGLVFIKKEDINSSAPPTEPGSPSNQRRGNECLIDDSELSMSCSSFSEYDEEEDVLEQHHGQDPSHGPDSIQNIDSSIHESESTDVYSGSSSSVVVDEASSVYFESNLPNDPLEDYFDSRTEDQKEEAKPVYKSPDAAVDSGSSTSHTLKEVGISESSESCEANDAQITMDLAQEESTSEFEYIPSGGEISK